MSSGSGIIQTTHAGSLPRPARLIEANRRHASDEIDDAELEGVLTASVAEVVRRQQDLGIDIVNDGEFGKPSLSAVDYGPWATYAFGRLEGWEDVPDSPPTFFMRDGDRFHEFYTEEVFPTLVSGGSARKVVGTRFTGPIRYTGHRAVERDIANMLAALGGSGPEHAFITSVAPASLGRGADPHYGSRREFLMALADALHEEWKAIVDAGFVLQIDDPSISDGWGIAPVDLTIEAYREDVRYGIEAVNRALEGLPRERVRYHCCWGSFHGPHSMDLPLGEFIDLLLEVNADAFAVEAGNVRHELDWKVWRGIDIPGNVTLIPGVVSHATNLIEPADLVADRLARYIEAVGPDRVLAGTDCGLGGRVHHEVAWAKLEALVEGARLASGQSA